MVHTRSSESVTTQRSEEGPLLARAAGRTGARLLCEALIQEGVDSVFGYPGGTVLPIYDELARLPHALRHILARHEQGAVHMAEGYARATGHVGVALVTSGPGVTNAITGIANAFKDSTPIVVVCGQVPLGLVGSNAFQEVDTLALMRSCTKYCCSVSDAGEIGSVIREAIRRAGSGRTGPVVVEIPRDVAAQTVSAWRSAPQRPVTSGPGPGVEAHLVAEAVKRLCSATRPVLYAGGGIVHSGCSKELVSLAEALDLPVAPTLMGLGCVPGDHRLCLGMLGMHGTYCANMAVAEADLLVAIGARFDDRVTGALEKFAPRAEIVHVDIDPSSIGAVVHPHLAIVADARRVLRHMLALLRVRKTAAGCGAERLDAWWARIAEWQRSAPLSYHASDAEIKPQRLCEELSRLADPEAIVTTDVGQHQMWLAQYYTFRKPRQLLTSGGLGTMGFGLPAAIGAAVAFPSRQVIAFVGDGGFQMTAQELSTAVQHRADIKVVVVNNGCLGMVRQWQELFYDRAYLAVDMEHTPDFVALAEAYGATGFRVGHPRDLAAQLSRALAAPGVVVIDVRVCRDENVYPMIPPGAGSSEMMLN